MAYLYYRSSHPFESEQVSDSLLPVRPIRSPFSHPIRGNLEWWWDLGLSDPGARTSARHTDAPTLSHESGTSADRRLSKRVGVG
jgi:hypothetical protein